MVGQAIQVSILAMGVIFLVLSILIGLIQVMVKLIPYEEPPTPPAKPRPKQTAGSEEEAETLAAIHVAVAYHRGQSPESIQITNVQPL